MRIKWLILVLIIFASSYAAAADKYSPESAVKGAFTVSPEKSYIKSTSKIGKKGERIYYKEFLKNPDGFKSRNVNITGQITQINESKGSTVIQLRITEKYDTVMIFYDGKVDVYEDDWVTAYGVCQGSYAGSTMMGASTSWPLIQAKYIKKRMSAD